MEPSNDELRLIGEIEAAQSIAELHALMPRWCEFFESQKDGPALDAATGRIRGAWDARLDALNAADR
jgi:hypothetical protein